MVLTITAFDRYQKLVAALYIVLGWAGLMLLPPLVDRPPCSSWWWWRAASTRWGRCSSRSTGRSSPRWFGYHEVWHALGIAAGAVLYLAAFELVRGA